MAQMEVDIKFSTNAKIVKQQIRELNSQIGDIATSAARLSSQIDSNRATSKNLTGDIRARQSIVKLDKQINHLAEQRTKMAMGDAQFGAQQQYIKSLIKTNEVMRIQRKILDDNATAMINMGKNTQWAGRQLVVGFTVPLTIAAGGAMKAFADLEKQLLQFKRVYGDVSTTSAQTDAMADSVKKLANEWVKYGVAVSDTIGLAAEAAGAGFQDKKLIAQVESANKLAVLGQLDQQKAMKSTIALQSTFKMSNEQLGKSINYLNQLENQTMVTMDDMTTAIPKAASVVEGLGGSVEDLGTMMAALREGGVSAAEGANALKSGLGSLLNPSKKAAEDLGAIGVSMPKMWAEAEKNGQGVIYVVEQLGKAMDTLGATKKQQIMEELFGKHQFARMNALLSNINKGAQAMQAKGVAASGSLEQALVAQQELGKLGASSLTRFQSSIEKFKTAIAPLGKIIMDVVTPLVNFATKVVDGFNNLPDIVKQITLGFVGLGGIVAPLFLMMLGQLQNLLGNGLKFLNFMRNWGKDTKWVNQENLDLANAIGVVNAKLIAENAILVENAGLWAARDAAAAGSVASTGAVVLPSKGKAGKRKKFAKGGSVSGGDTVPALLTPGEFVVNKSAAKRFGGMLHAMNSGNVPGFSTGISNVQVPPRDKKSVDWSHMTVDMKFDPAKVTGSKAALGRFMTAMEVLKLDPSKYLKMVSKFVLPLPAGVNQGLKQGVQADSLRQYFASSSIDKQNQPFARTLYGMGQGNLAKSGSTVGAQRYYYNEMDKWLAGKGTTKLDDAAMARRSGMIVAMMRGNPEYRQFGTTLGMAMGTAGQVRQVSGSDLAQKAIQAGKPGLLKDLGLKWFGAGQGARSNKFNQSMFYGRPNKGIAGLFKKTFARGMVPGFANGGIVPGQGNKDTVPAMLAPGEAVITKKATKRFGGILHAMNKGAVGMFAGGKDQGARKNWTPDEAYPESKIKAAMEDYRRQIDAAADSYAEMTQLNEEQTAQLKKTMHNAARGPGQSSHIIPEFDPQGNKIYRKANTIVTPQLENNAMTQLAGSKKNMEALNKALDQLVKDALAVGDSSDDVAKAQKEYAKVLQRLEQGEHIVDEAQRVMASEMITRAHEMGGLTPSTQASGQALAASMLIPVKNLENTPGSTALADQQRAAIAARGNVNKPPASPGKEKPVKVELADDTPLVKTGSKGLDLSTLAFAIPMLLGSFTGLTESLGSLNEVIGATSAAMLLFGNNIPKGGGMAGILGRGTPAEGAGKIKGAFGKYGLGAGAAYGAIGGLAGGVAGNLIKDQKHGARDVIGQGVSWGATGAGIGMMFGPWGAAIGGATAALAGLTLQLWSNAKAHKKAEESAMKTSQAWDNIAKDLNEKYSLGTGKTLADLMSGVGAGSEREKALYETLKQNELGPDGAFTKRIGELQQQQSVGAYRGPETDINSLILKERGIGVSESDIKIIVQAFIAALPPNMRGGLDAATYEAPTTNQILDKLDQMTKVFGENVGKTVGVMGTQNVTGASGYGTTQQVITQQAKLDPMAVVQGATLANAAFKSLTETLLNAEEGSKEYKTAEEQLIRLRSDAKYMQLNANMAGRGDKFNETLGLALDDMVKNNMGNGLKEGEWKTFLDQGHQNSVELSSAAQAILLGGESLKDAAGNLMSAGNIIQMAGQMEAKSKMLGELGDVHAKQDKYKEARGILEDIRKNPMVKPKTPASQGALDKAQAGQDARQNKWDKINRGWAIKNASLDIARIHIEEKALKDFVGKFNKAFGTSIDSFADAQYEIEKIGLKIRAIQVKTIEPLQKKADDMRRVNELRQRKVDELQKKEQERVDAINKSYDEQAKVLERIGQEQEFINNEASAAAELTAAYTTGNIADITKASIGLTKTVNQYGQQQQGRGLEEGRDAQLANSPYQAEIDKITKQIDTTEKSILAVEDQIYNINKAQVEPMQRRADLMSLMLDTTKSMTEHLKANAKGVDQENLARKEALSNAREALDNAKHSLDVSKQARKVAKEQRDLDKESNDLVDSRITKVQELTGMQSTNLNTLESGLDKLDKQQKTREDRLNTVIDELNANMLEIKNNSYSATDAWGQLITRGGTAALIDSAMEFAKTGKAPDPSKYPMPKDQNGEPPLSRPGKPAKYTGGPIEGDGGQDSVPTLLTPGEYVMRRSAVKRLGVHNLRRMNQGADTDGLFTGGLVKLATGGVVPKNMYGRVEEDTLDKLVKNQKIDKAITDMTAQSVQTGGDSGGSPAEGYIPSGPIPGLASKEPGPSGYPAEHASWIKRSAVRMMRYVKHAFPTQFTGTTYNSNGEHGTGKAVDYMIRKPYRSAAGQADGWRLAKWATKWRKPLGVRGVIFSDHITGYGRWGGWRPYQHFSGSRSDTDRHLNHNHIINYSKGGLVPGAGGIDSMPSMLTPGEFVVNKNAVDRVGHLPLKKLNAGTQLNPVTNDNVSGGDSMAVYNDYSLIFNVNEQIDTRDMARVVMREIQRATNSQVKQRR